MNRVHTIHVVPALPEKLKRLREIAMDTYWTWNHDAIDLFRRMDQNLWRKVGQNPIRLLSEAGQEKLNWAADDGGFLSHLDRVWLDFEVYRSERTWYQSHFGDVEGMKVAYFSAEFGLHECLPVYSGGLGILAGDHMKAASDMGLPITGIGLMYQKGYFRQYLNADGWQQERYPEIDPFHLPMELVRDSSNKPIEFSVRVGPREVLIHIWLIRVGRINLYLLDTNVLANNIEDRRITETLYGGDTEMRIRQEIVLGIGGMYALHALGIEPNIFHMNEGHSAFLALERIRQLMANEGLLFAEAKEAACASHVFTTHTPVPAGIDRFSQELMVKYFQDFWPSIGLDKEQFMNLGGADPEEPENPFNMAILAIGLSAFMNGVSDLHAKVSQEMWQDLWPDLPVDETPIDSVKNGIHARSWIAGEMGIIYNRYLGPNWQENPSDKELWKGVRDVSAEELWRVMERQRARLVSFARNRLRSQMRNRGETKAMIERARDVLDMETLTIGFARRFATYKRANLLFRDPERLKRLLTNPEFPVQIIFAGKAHPRDDGGKKLIRDIVHFARDEEVRNRIVFLEDYDINVARHMVQGSDIWLNTPRRPYEASGTSGMKAAVNGVLNCSTLDGWWADTFNPEIGWAIGSGEMYEDEDYQDKIESEALYDILEKEIVPLFYQRDKNRVPWEWTEIIKRNLEHVCPVYITTRMVEDYTRKAYIPCYQRLQRLREDGWKKAKEVTEWQHMIGNAWSEVKVGQVITSDFLEIHTGDSVEVHAKIHLGDLKPEDVCVEGVIGQLGGNRNLQNPVRFPLEFNGLDKEGDYLYTGVIQCNFSGNHGYAVRVLPFHEDLNNPLNMGLVEWE